MTITIETAGNQEIEKLLEVLKALNIKSVRIKEQTEMRQPIISKGDKNIDPRDLFGIWKKNPLTIEQIRASAWNRNTDHSA